MSKLILFQFIFLSFGSYADFTFNCLGETDKAKCIKQFKARDKDGFRKQDGSKDKSFKRTPSDFCGVKDKNVSCHAAPDSEGLWVCEVKSPICSRVTGVLESYPPKYECQGADSVAAFTNRVGSDGQGGTMTFTEALFCVSKSASAGSATNGAAGQK